MLESMWGAGVLEMPGERFYQIIWEQFDSVGPDEVGKVLNAA